MMIENEHNLFGALLDNANLVGEDFNDGDSFPGWLTAKWVSDRAIRIDYETPDHEKTMQIWQIVRVV